MMAVLCIATIAEAALTDNLDGTVTDGRGLMWLQTPLPGMTWDNAMLWADTLSFAGHNDWRLPSAADFDTGLPDTVWNSVNYEWGYLYGVEWGNPTIPPDTFPMTGYLPGWYWTSTELTPVEAYAFYATFDGLWLNDIQPKNDPSIYVTAVRDAEAALTPPVASFEESTHTATIGTTINFDASTSYDPDGTIILYEWDFTSDGSYDATGIGTSYAYMTPGTYTVTLRVTDDDGLTDTATDTKTITRLDQVIPEIPLGTIMGLVTMIAAFAVFKSKSLIHL